MAAHTILFAALEASRAGRQVAPISTPEGLSTVSTATGVKDSRRDPRGDPRHAHHPTLIAHIAGAGLGGAKLGAGAFGPAYTVSSQHPLPYAIAAVALAAFAAVLAITATHTTIHHDIT